MRTIALSWEAWRDIIAALYAKGLPYMREHTDALEQQLEQHGPDQATVTLSLTHLLTGHWRLPFAMSVPGRTTRFSIASSQNSPRMGRSPLLTRAIQGINGNSGLGP